MIRVVPDTNILISSIFWRGKPYNIIKGGIVGKYALITSKEILEELTTELITKFNLPEQALLYLMDIIFTHFHVVQKVSNFNIARDSSDDKILETAYDGKADYIVTGDPDILVLREFKGIRILTAAQFLKL